MVNEDGDEPEIFTSHPEQPLTRHHQIKVSGVSGSKRRYLGPHFNKLTKELMHFHEHSKEPVHVCVCCGISLTQTDVTLCEVGGESE